MPQYDHNVYVYVCSVDEERQLVNMDRPFQYNLHRSSKSDVAVSEKAVKLNDMFLHTKTNMVCGVTMYVVPVMCFLIWQRY